MSIDKIICVGKNYLEHALELGDAVPEKPVIFLKPASVLKQVKQWGDTLQLDFPNMDDDVHPECELVLRVGCDGYQMNSQQASDALQAVSIGLDMTLRTRQAQLKKNGHPWTTAKVFKDAAIIGPWISVADFYDYMDTTFTMMIDDKIRQQGQGNQMRLKPVEIIEYVSQFFPLCKGDIIFTGTPAGVGPIMLGSNATLNWAAYHFQVEWN